MWLEPRASMPSDHDLADVEEFHANLRAALDWSVTDPPAGLRFFGLLARPWTALGNSGDTLAAADLLLTNANAELYPAAWLTAANETSYLRLAARGVDAFVAFLEHVEVVATLVGDDYQRALAAHSATQLRPRAPSRVTSPATAVTTIGKQC